MTHEENYLHIDYRNVRIRDVCCKNNCNTRAMCYLVLTTYTILIAYIWKNNIIYYSICVFENVFSSCSNE